MQQNNSYTIKRPRLKIFLDNLSLFNVYVLYIYVCIGHAIQYLLKL